MVNNSRLLLLKKIESLENITNSIFIDVLNSYNLSKEEYDDLLNKNPSVQTSLNEVIEFFSKKERSYFTISSREDFNNLTQKKEIIDWEETIIYHPLNDHSRQYLRSGDILFCYRQGQFSTLNDALNTRGIYGVGIAATDPLEIFPDKSGYKKYGIVVCFPFLLRNHLQLRNIQMHPKTIDLTPYNGNRNDALQHISEKKHYETLIGMIAEKNNFLRPSFERIFNKELSKTTLPEIKWNSHIVSDSELNSIEFNYNLFVDTISSSGLNFNSMFLVRVISSLLTKNFLILTGLSGSGKTKLAQSISYWFSFRDNPLYSILKKALQGEEFISNYDIVSVSDKLVELINTSGSSGKIIPLPVEAIFEWYNALADKTISSDGDPKKLRHIVAEKSKFQKHIHGFYNELHKIAVVMYLLKSSYSDYQITNVSLIPVGADWTNREPLLGYPNALKTDEYIKPENGALDIIISANENPDIPHFLILDEMNLSHVERYFADFLSAMESNEEIPLHSGAVKDGTPASIPLPSNLFIIGTVNIDETTYMFSPKVLDRANTIEFRVSKEEIKTFLDNASTVDIDQITGKGAAMGKGFLEMARKETYQPLDDEIRDKLISFFEELKKAGAEFGYRSASEIIRLINKLSVIDNNLTNSEKLDIAVMQKLLPKLHGSRRKLCPILLRMAGFCITGKIQNIESEVFNQEYFDFNDTEKVVFPLSLEKIARMYKGAIENGFTSYAEA